MSRLGVKKKGRDWEAFWGIVWYNLIHASGVLAVLSIAVGIIWSIFGPSPAPRPSITTASVEEKLSSSNREAMQINFNRDLVSAAKPCATKTKNVSNVAGCSLFGLQLGTLLEVAKHTLDSSGYFAHPAELTRTCTKPKKDGEKDEACTEGYIFQRNEAISVTVYFSETSPESKNLYAQRIQLVLGPAGNPYLDADSMRAQFVKQFGPPDEVFGNSNKWGSPSSKEGGITAYHYKGSYWVTLERTK